MWKLTLLPSPSLWQRITAAKQIFCLKSMVLAVNERDDEWVCFGGVSTKNIGEAKTFIDGMGAHLNER